VRGTFDWEALHEKRTRPNTDIEGPKWGSSPTIVILCHNIIGAVAYADIEGPKWGSSPTIVILCHNINGAVAYLKTKCVLKVKLLSVAEMTCAKY
jgi:hypothetical protein